VTRVWLIRHAASTAAPRSAIGVSDPPLSDLGRKQAVHLAATMSKEPLVRIVSSDRQRALATARILALPHGLDIESTAALRELDFGAWEGRSLADLWLEEPLAAKAWEGDIRSTPPSFGESVRDLERRVGMLWDSLQPLPSVGELAFVAHQGSLAVLRAVITRETISAAFATRLALAGAVAVTTP
jgi:broad specificity phosphatase PhoE